MVRGRGNLGGVRVGQLVRDARNFGGVCYVCVSVWSVPAWELDSRGHGYGLVGVCVCGLYPRGNWTHVATGTAWLV